MKVTTVVLGDIKDSNSCIADECGMLFQLMEKHVFPKFAKKMLMLDRKLMNVAMMSESRQARCISHGSFVL